MFIRIGDFIFNKNNIKYITIGYNRGKECLVVMLDNDEDFFIEDDYLSLSDIIEILDKEVNDV